MSKILGADGKPVEKKWEEMDLDEKLNVLRLGIGALIQQGNALGTGLQRIIAAMDEMDMAGEPIKVADAPHLKTDDGHNCGLHPEQVEPTIAQPKMSSLDQVPQ